MAMSVDLPEGLEREIDEEIGRGRYKSKSELIRDAVRRLLEERGKIEHRELSEKAQRGIDEGRESEKEYTSEEVRKKLGIQE